MKLHLKFTTGGGAWDDSEPCVQKWLVEEIQKERERDESVMFGMQVNVEAIYYGDTWVSDVEMSPHCEGLKVQFVPHKGSARLTQPNRNFTVPIGWKPFSLF
ncbi:GTP cyclohydrolase I [Senna tora]|uniref:GTP cyclohydrolase I n=1 Tax=Senna tora TaxID=362788 RepID=A0A834WDS6_9FABA|nr:GTP cyclohydrolase I [Senna tora]